MVESKWSCSLSPSALKVLGLKVLVLSSLVLIFMFCSSSLALAFDSVVAGETAGLRRSGHRIPKWLVGACERSLSGEHYDCRGCKKCRSRIRLGVGYVGPLQFSNDWKHYPCNHGYPDWRLCKKHSVRRFLHGGAHYGKRFIRRHWRQTCGKL
jgi:hypothetical protein